MCLLIFFLASKTKEVGVLYISVDVFSGRGHIGYYCVGCGGMVLLQTKLLPQNLYEGEDSSLQIGYLLPSFGSIRSIHSYCETV